MKLLFSVKNYKIRGNNQSIFGMFATRITILLKGGVASLVCKLSPIQKQKIKRECVITSMCMWYYQSMSGR